MSEAQNNLSKPFSPENASSFVTERRAAREAISRRAGQKKKKKVSLLEQVLQETPKV